MLAGPDKGCFYDPPLGASKRKVKSTPPPGPVPESIPDNETKERNTGGGYSIDGGGVHERGATPPEPPQEVVRRRKSTPKRGNWPKK